MISPSVFIPIAEEAGLNVDRTAFDALMLEQRTRAKADARISASSSGITTTVS